MAHISKKEIVRIAADELIKDTDSAISWHIRIKIETMGVSGFTTSMCNYYMKKMVADGLYTSEKAGNYAIIYKKRPLPR